MNHNMGFLGFLAAMMGAKSGDKPELPPGLEGLQDMLQQTRFLAGIAAGYESWKSEGNEPTDFQAEHDSLMPLVIAVHEYHEWLHDKLGDLDELHAAAGHDDQAEVEVTREFTGVELAFDIVDGQDSLSDEDKAQLTKLGKKLAKLGVRSVKIDRK